MTVGIKLIALEQLAQKHPSSSEEKFTEVVAGFVQDFARELLGRFPGTGTGNVEEVPAGRCRTADGRVPGAEVARTS
jgi:hypothetical protein